MSKLNELIQVLCPDGVDFRPLEKCCRTLDNKRKPVTKTARVAGEYPYYGANGIQDYVSDYIYDGTFVLIGEDGSVITKTGTPVVTWAEGKIWVNNHAHIIKEIDGVLLRYIYHYIQTINISPLIHGNIPKLTGKDFKALSIPIPPLPVQEEIVRILDTFTELTTELTTELSARKKQYEYYQSMIFRQSDAAYLTLKECCMSISDGDHQAPPKSDVGVPFITISNIQNNKIDFTNSKYVPLDYFNQLDPKRVAKCGDILYTVVGSYGIPVYIDNDIPFAFQRHIAILRPKKNIIVPKFLYYSMKTTEFFKQAELNALGAAQKTISLSALNKFKIAVPPLAEQERIVSILDRFDTICNDLTSGLPAEIEARKKQYEYYRDKLLTFMEKE